MATTLERTRARLGARLLDVLKPGWHKAINTVTLQMSGCNACVLGQLFGNYHRGAEQLFAMRLAEVTDPDKKADTYNAAADEVGFYVNTPGYKARAKRYSNLTAAWRDEIDKRVKRDTPVPTETETKQPARLFCATCGHDRCPTPVDRMGNSIGTQPAL